MNVLLITCYSWDFYAAIQKQGTCGKSYGIPKQSLAIQSARNQTIELDACGF